MHIILLILLLLLLLFGPQLWVQWVLRRHSQPREDFPGSGGEFARHLLDRFDLQDVKVEGTDKGDHYDPQARAVRLSPDKLDGRSLTAVTVAAHEVGHALQHQAGYRPLEWRSRMVFFAQAAQQLGTALFIGVPIVTALTRAPGMGLLLMVGALASFGSAALVHLVTLPVELDASFKRALPILESGYLPPGDRRAARRILTAAAWTYVAASLASLLNLWRWLRMLKA